MSKLTYLKATATLSDLANLLQFKPSALSYILFKLPPTAKYRVFDIPKRNGGTRTIKAPIDQLMAVQRRLSTLLQDCLDEINKAKGRKDRISHGFKRERSICSNAKEHRNRRYVFNLDLEDFFPSINFGRVRGYFINDKSFSLDPSVATVIAQIACHDNALPQGSPCSPVISNLIGHVLDIHLVRIASRAGCTYSRYADDLTFSTNKKTFPIEIAEPALNDPHLWVPSAELQRLIKHSGFQINVSKTRMQYEDSRQEITGLVVNERINVRREYSRNVRAMVHTLLKAGSFEAYGEISNSGITTVEKRKGTVNQLHGMLGFIDSIDLFHRNHGGGSTQPVPVANKGAAALTSREKIYRRFLIYTNFFAAEAPVVLCEGETDNVYLTHAIRSLAPNYPLLAAVAPDGKIRLNVRLYKYRHSSTARILGLGDGGSSVLSTFIGTYNRETANFNAPGMKHPVVVLFDNDAGASPIRDAVKSVSKKPLMPTEPFAQVVRNLYVLATPLVNGATESKIEDFFEASVKATVVGGKSFDVRNKFDTATHYGKKIFAQRVVVPNASSIDFSGFHPLLKNLSLAIASHKQP